MFLYSAVKRRVNQYLEKYYNIYLYHRVNPDLSSNLFDLKVSPRKFESHVQLILKHKKVVFADDLVRNKFEGKAENYAAITFDDGYEDNFIHALPIIKKYKIPVTIFLTTAFVDSVGDWMLSDLAELAFKGNKLKGDLKEMTQRCRFLKREEFTKLLGVDQLDENDSRPENRGLNWSQIREMHETGLIRFEAHGHQHMNYMHLNEEDIKKDISTCRSIIERELNYKSKVFAYPFGSVFDVNMTSHRIVKEMGFEAAFMATNSKTAKSESPFNYNRIVCAEDHIIV